MFTRKDFNLRQRRWLELLNDYDICVLYHTEKANVVENSLNRMTMGSVSHIDEAKKDLVRDLHRLGRLVVRLEDFSDSGFMVHNNSESSLVGEVMSKQHLDKSLMEFKDKVLGKLNDAFSIMGWYLKVSREIMCSQGR